MIHKLDLNFKKQVKKIEIKKQRYGKQIKGIKKN